MGPGMPPTHHLAGPGPPGAAREPPRPPNGHTPAGASRAAAGWQIEHATKSTKSDGGAAGEGGGGGGDGGGDAQRACGAHSAVGGDLGAVGGT